MKTGENGGDLSTTLKLHAEIDLTNFNRLL
jgi:hypothetical protein